MSTIATITIPAAAGVLSPAVSLAGFLNDTPLTIQLPNTAIASDAADFYAGNISNASSTAQLTKIPGLTIPAAGESGRQPSQPSGVPYAFLYAVRTNGTGALSATINGQETPGTAGGGGSGNPIVQLGNRGLWELDSSSTLTPNDLTVISAPSGGNYLRLPGGNPGASTILQWYVDSAGSVDADGVTPTTPIPFAEFLQRMGGQETNAFINVSITGDESINDFETGYLRPSNDTSITLSGVLAVVNPPGRTYTIQAVTVWSGSTDTIGHYQLQDDLGGHPDLTALGWANGGVVLQDTTTGYECTVGDDLGNGTFNGAWLDPVGLSSVEPSVGDVVRAVKAPYFDFLYLDNPNAGGVLNIRHIDMGGFTHRGSGNTNLVECRMGMTYGCENNVDSNDLNIFGGLLQGMFNFGAMATVSLFVNSDFRVYGGGLVSLQGNMLVVGGSIIIGDPKWSPGVFTVAPVSVLASKNYETGFTGEALTVHPGCLVQANGKYWCQSSGSPTTGIHIHPGGTIVYATGLLPNVNANNPTNPWLVATSSLSQATVAASVNLTVQGAGLYRDA